MSDPRISSLIPNEKEKPKISEETFKEILKIYSLGKRITKQQLRALAVLLRFKKARGFCFDFLKLTGHIDGQLGDGAKQMIISWFSETTMSQLSNEYKSRSIFSKMFSRKKG